MTKDEIIAMAKEAGFNWPEIVPDDPMLIVAHDLATFMRKLGETPSPRLLSLIAKVEGTANA